jgi:hypothetical protein
MKVYYTYCINPTCFGHSYGHLQGGGGALQRMDTSKYYSSIRTNAQTEILNFKMSK